MPGKTRIGDMRGWPVTRAARARTASEMHSCHLLLAGDCFRSLRKSQMLPSRRLAANPRVSPRPNPNLL
eukprot:2479103-Alexandrium_andersonii.AAC.1